MQILSLFGPQWGGVSLDPLPEKFPRAEAHGLCQYSAMVTVGGVGVMFRWSEHVQLKEWTTQVFVIGPLELVLMLELGEIDS